MLDILRTYLSRIDERPLQQIDADIDDELATHLALLEEELIESGLSPAAAREQAVSRFGNPQIHKRRCRDVALRERRMKTYAQTIVIIACGLLLGAVTTAVWFNQRSANAALAGMSQRMDDLARSVGVRVPVPAPTSTASTMSTWSVYITGSPVSRPGQYALPVDGLSLRRLLAISGTEPRFVKEIVVRHKNENTPETPWETIGGDRLADPTGDDTMLKDGDLVTVIERRSSNP